MRLRTTRLSVFIGLLLLLGSPTSARAQWLQHLFRKQPCCPSQPPVCVSPAPPTTPTTEKPTTEKPTTPPVQEPVPELPQTAAGVQGGLGLAYGAAERSPNMFGEFFGGSTIRIALQLPPIPGINQNISISHFNPAGSPALFGLNFGNGTFSNTGPVIAQGTGGFNVVFPSGLTFNAAGPISSPPTPVNANSQETQALAQFAPGKFGPGGTLNYLNGTATFNSSNSTSLYTIDTNYNYFRAPVPQTVFLDVPSPAGGGVVGRTKISEDNNPLPRDRVIFEYDYFNNVPLTNVGVGVHRFAPGIEKTFFDRLTSLEIRFPFASTLDSNLNSGAGDTSRAVEFGNVHITLKGLIYRSPEFNVAVGLGIDLPTASDTRVFFTDGTEIVRIKNEDVILTPYFAYLWTPNDRLFFQNWFEFCIDPNGNPVLVNPDFTSLRTVGRITDQTVMQIDAQIGYWLYRSERNSQGITALAPFIELHYNTTLNKADTVQAGAFSIGSTSDHFDQLNISTGFMAQIGENFTLSIGAAFPLKNGPDRSFDYQLGLRVNWFFGPTARERSRATAVQGF
jgi:hypothetical protein